mgnify:CR=1 FL=1
MKILLIILVVIVVEILIVKAVARFNHSLDKKCGTDKWERKLTKHSGQ